MIPQARTRSDGQLTFQTSLPAAGESVTSNAFDIIGDGPSLANVIAPPDVDFRISIPALPNNTSSSDSVSATLMDSADGVSFAAVAGIAPLIVPGVASSGSAAVSDQFPVPSNIRRYAAVRYTATSGAGNNTASQATFQQMF